MCRILRTGSARAETSSRPPGGAYATRRRPTEIWAKGLARRFRSTETRDPVLEERQSENYGWGQRIHDESFSTHPIVQGYRTNRKAAYQRGTHDLPGFVRLSGIVCGVQLGPSLLRTCRGG